MASDLPSVSAINEQGGIHLWLQTDDRSSAIATFVIKVYQASNQIIISKHIRQYPL